MACISASVLTPVHAQEVSSVVDGRVDSGVGAVPSVSPGAEHRGGWDLGAVISAAYDDNIFLSNTSPTADMVFRIAPALAYTQGDAKEGEGGFIQAAYQPTGVIYADKGENNRIDQSAALTAGWRGKASTLTYKGVARKLGDATPDTGSQTERVELASELRGAWTPREKVSVELAAGGTQTNYDSPTLVDSGKIYGEVAMRYAYSPKTEVGLVYQAGQLKIEGGNSQTTQQLSGSIDWQPREKIHVKLEAGAGIRKSGDSSTVNPLVNARIDWTPYEGTKLFISARQNDEVSALNQGQIYNVKAVTAGVSQRLGGKWTGLLQAGYEVDSYDKVRSTGAPSRTDRLWFVRPALNYQFSGKFDGSLYYQASNDSSTDADFGYDESMIGIEFNYQF